MQRRLVCVECAAKASACGVWVGGVCSEGWCVWSVGGWVECAVKASVCGVWVGRVCSEG